MSIGLKNKKIWMFHHYATPPTMNGFTRPYDFGVNLLNYGIKTTVFTSAFLHFSGENLITNDENYIIDNNTEIPHVFIKTREYSTNGLDRVFNMLSFYINLFKVTKQYLKNNDKPNYILASSPHPLTMIAGIKIAKKLNIPCICEVRDFWPEVIFYGGKLKEKSLLGRVLLNIEYWIYKKADALIFLKEGDYTYITNRKWDIANGGDIDLDKTYYINNGVDLNSFDENIKKYQFEDEDLASNKFNVIYTGALRPVNNVDAILDAAKHLANEKIQFVIYGSGSLEEHLKERILDENISNVILKGRVDKKYIPYILSNSDLNLLHYSQNQYNWKRGNSSNKLFEYLASTKPVLSTVKMGYSIIDKYQCGFELNDPTPKQIAEEIERISNFSKVEFDLLSQNARKASEEFDFTRLTQKLENIILNILH